MIAHAMRQKSFTSAPYGSVSIDGFPFATSPIRINIQRVAIDTAARSAIPMISQGPTSKLRNCGGAQCQIEGRIVQGIHLFG